MTARELDAAGITEPALRAAYAHCRRLNARHGKTYFLATRLLPVARRPAVHALYGFARWADDIVDSLDAGATPQERASALLALETQLNAGLARGGGDEPVVRALAHTSAVYGIDPAYFTAFMASMRADLDVTDYPTYDDLRRYMYGSAEVIGLQMLPVLGTVTPREEAAPHAAALGAAFQLTNFLRDVGEDLDRGRVYLPADLLAAHDVDRELLRWSRLTGGTDARITAALRAAADLTRGVYRRAAPGVAMLDPVSRPCIRTAFILYRGILDAVEADGFAVLHRRAVVSRPVRATVALDGLVRVTAARTAGRTATRPGGNTVDAPRRPAGRGRYPLSLRRRPVAWERQRPTWRDAAPGVIAGALERARSRPSGNWYAVGAARDVGRDRPLGRTVAGAEVVLWRAADGRLRGGPGACPHLGAPLKDSPVRCGTLVCHWHGLALDGGPFAGWEPYPVYDDGVLVWVRLDRAGGEEPLARPRVPRRPDTAGAVASVYTGVGRCEPEDVVANRLDPWHGAWFHPYSFVDLTVTDGPAGPEDALTVDVSFKVAGRLVVPVRAEFTAPGPRTVVMRITEGEGAGSVVETHATPLGADASGRPRTAVVEAVVAASGRPGFAVARAAAPLLRPLMRATAGRLWRDDMAYAERRWELRSSGRFPG
ncbi:(2Fe-2S) ferredoxin [Streptomyces paromomycinus]|uniref:(2Fe-2S) ferredoxin n=1 Tax=Streptomyces paromomycinus TaxID=92743 RepID=A0A401WG99_STREY|nr:(2Fe-2S) ferredoxin [Streptomyces paromomycinus]